MKKDIFGSKRRQAGGRESKAGEEMEKTGIEQPNEGSTEIYIQPVEKRRSRGRRPECVAEYLYLWMGLKAEKTKEDGSDIYKSD